MSTGGGVGSGTERQSKTSPCLGRVGGWPSIIFFSASALCDQTQVQQKMKQSQCVTRTAAAAADRIVARSLLRRSASANETGVCAAPHSAKSGSHLRLSLIRPRPRSWPLLNSLKTPNSKGSSRLSSLSRSTGRRTRTTRPRTSKNKSRLYVEAVAVVVCKDANCCLSFVFLRARTHKRLHRQQKHTHADRQMASIKPPASVDQTAKLPENPTTEVWGHRMETIRGPNESGMDG